MSLINDALKRAKDAQPPASASDSPGPRLRAVDPAQQPVRASSPMVLLILSLALFCALFLAWEHYGNTSRTETRAASPPQAPTTVVRAAEPAAPAVAAAESQSPALRDAEPGRAIASGPAAGQVTQSEHLDTSAPAAAATNAPTTASSTSATANGASRENQSTNSLATPEPAPPKPAPLKLQAIIFNPSRPSATISGRTVFIGDRIREFRVLNITQDSATLASPGQTNILSLAE